MLSHDEILKELVEGRIVISPFDKRNLGTNSYDVTLGEWYYREQAPKKLSGIFSEDALQRLYNPYDAEDVVRVWGKQIRAIEAQGFELDDFKLKNIRREDRIIVLNPGENILAHTNEFIGGRNGITSHMRARSSFGRSSITVCRCAGMGDVGFVNRWTMEISNNSQYYTIVLVVGRRIAQIAFEAVGPSGDYTEEGKYQSHLDLEDLREAWKPSMMLPRLHLDRECLVGDP